jgi:MYXO-CTERM domain-containing protein
MAGASDATLQITSDDPVAPLTTIALHGVGAQPGLMVNPLNLDFGVVAVNTLSAARPLTLTNTGDGPLTIASVGSSDAQFAVDRGGPFTVAAGAMQTVLVTFTPTAAGDAAATIMINPDGGGLTLVNVALTGTGASPTLSLAPMSIDFGLVPVGTKSDPQTVTLTNTGKLALAIGPLVASDPVFKVDVSATQMMLAPGMMTTFTVAFAPSAAAMVSATVPVSSAAGVHPLAIMKLQGQGAPAPKAPGCSIATRPPVGGGWALVALALVVALRRRRR